MTESLTRAAFDAAPLSKRWSLCRLNFEGDGHLSDSHSALDTYFNGFDPEVALATCRSGVAILLRGERPAEKLGPVLQLEAAVGNETRILRHIGGQRWRLSRLTEGDGDELIAEDIRWLGTGAAGESEIAALQYRRYWRIAHDGALMPVAARLTGVAANKQGVTR